MPDNGEQADSNLLSQTSVPQGGLRSGWLSTDWLQSTRMKIQRIVTDRKTTTWGTETDGGASQITNMDLARRTLPAGMNCRTRQVLTFGRHVGNSPRLASMGRGHTRELSVARKKWHQHRDGCGGRRFGHATSGRQEKFCSRKKCRSAPKMWEWALNHTRSTITEDPRPQQLAKTSSGSRQNRHSAQVAACRIVFARCKQPLYSENLKV